MLSAYFALKFITDDPVTVVNLGVDLIKMKFFIQTLFAILAVSPALATPIPENGIDVCVGLNELQCLKPGCTWNGVICVGVTVGGN
ncbi:hypothetical protein H072_7891 [Dactylellina haptotyla CBS 200.50]|uniref:Uncharacterized protein n=1 Tax=Dactylellina haptotyla (strain CBS 200.50) TaxID=1284197 RepID=S8A5W3_DACHA|nr:hypothetical protein H072_7891 [Dactylellina haptotyla CBS 200.50]